MINVLRNGKHLPQPHSLPPLPPPLPVCERGCVCVGGCMHEHIYTVCVCSFTCVCICVYTSFCSWLCVCMSCIFACLVFCVHFSHTHTGLMCVCACAHCADWAGVLAIRKTTSGKVHINHVPQLKERNGAEMGGKCRRRRGRRRKNNERLCLRYSELLCCSVWSGMMLEALWISKVMTIGSNPLGRENQRLIYLHFFHRDNLG